MLVLSEPRTVRTVFYARNLLYHKAQKLLLDVCQKFELTTCRLVIENCISFKNVFVEKTVTIWPCLLIFPLKTRIKKKLLNTLLICYKTESFAKNTFKKLTFINNATVNELFHAPMCWSNV